MRILAISSVVTLCLLSAACKKDDTPTPATAQGQAMPGQMPGQYPQQQGYPQQGYPQTGYPQAQGQMAPQGYPQQGQMAPQGYPQQPAPGAAPMGAPAAGAPGAPAAGGGQLATPGPLALPCQNDQACGLAHCNTQYGKCAFPCQSAADCIQGATCNTMTGFCLPGGG